MENRWRFSVADPGFSWGDANSQSGCPNLLFCKLFAENCMKMKEFGPGGLVSLVLPLDPPMVLPNQDHEIFCPDTLRTH